MTQFQILCGASSDQKKSELQPRLHSLHLIPHLAVSNNSNHSNRNPTFPINQPSSCASLHSQFSSAHSTPYPTPQSELRAPPHSVSAASTAPPNEQPSSVRCPASPSSAPSSDPAQKTCPTTQTSPFKRQTANGKPSSAPSNSASSAKRAPSPPAPGLTISTTPTPERTRARAAVRRCTRRTTSSTLGAGGPHFGTRFRAPSARRRIPALG